MKLSHLCRPFETNYMSIILWSAILEAKEDRDVYKAEKKERKRKSTRCWRLPLDTAKSGPHTKTERCSQRGGESYGPVDHAAAVAVW